MILQPLSKAGKTNTTQTSNSVSSTRVLPPLSKTTTKTAISKTPVVTKAPIVTKPKTIPITPPKIITKPSVSIKGEPSGVQRLKIASKAGIKSLPSMVKTMGALLAENVAMQQRYIQKVSPKILGGAIGLNTTSPLDPILEPLYKKIEKKAPEVREKAIKERQTKIEPYAKLSKPEGFAQTVAEALVFNLPQMAVSTGLTVLTGLVSKNPTLTASVGLSTSYGLGASEVYTEARSNGLSDKQALPLSTVGGAIIGALDFTGVFRLIRKTTSPVTKEIEKSLVKNISKELVSVGTQAGIEGITEGLQEIVGNAIRISYSENKDIKQLVDNVGVASVVGAIMGGGVDATLSIGKLAKGATLQETLDSVDSTVENALKTPPKERTPEEKAIVEEALTQNLTPDEAIQLVTEGKLTTTQEGKELMKAVLVAKQENQNIRITLEEEGGILNIELASPDGKEEVAPEVDEVEITHGTNKSLEEVKTKGLQVSRNPIKQLGGAVYFTDSKELASDFGDNAVNISTKDLNFKTFNSPEEITAFIKEMKTIDLSKAIIKQGEFDGFIVTNPDPAVGNTFGITNVKKVNQIVKGEKPKIDTKSEVSIKDEKDVNKTKDKKEEASKSKKPQKLPEEKIKEIEDYVDKKGVKFRTDATTDLILSMPKREVTSRFFSHPDIIGKEFIGYKYLENLSKSVSIPLKAEERQIIQKVLQMPEFKDVKQINMADFKKTVIGELLPLDVIRTDTYSDYGSSNIYLDNLNTKTYLLNSPFEHGRTGHFSSDFSITLEKGEVEIKEIPVSEQNPSEKFAVIRTGVELNEQNIEENVLTLAESRKKAEEWIDTHTVDPTKPETVKTGTYGVSIRKKGLFSHFRTFDGALDMQVPNSKITYVAEMQSDVFQQGIPDAKKEIEERIANFEERLANEESRLKEIADGENVGTEIDKENVIKEREDSIQFIKKKIKELQEELKNLPEKDKSEFQFSSYKGIWQERTVREAINIKASEGFEVIRFPTPRTVAVIEGFAGNDENSMPYEIDSAEDEERLTFGDTINYGGEEMTVVEADNYNIKVAPSEAVRHFSDADAREEDIQNQWEETVYEFEGLEKDFGAIDTIEKLEEIGEQVNTLQKLAKFNSKAEDIKRLQETFDSSKENAQLALQKKEVANYEKFQKLLKEGIVRKEKLTLENLEDLRFKDKLEEKYGIGHSYWNYILNAYKYAPANRETAKNYAEATEWTLDAIKPVLESRLEELAEIQTTLNGKKVTLDKEIDAINSRIKPTPEELKGIPKDLVKDPSRYQYGLDYNVQRIFDIVAQRGTIEGEKLSLDDIEEDWKNSYAETYEPDYEGIYGEDKVFFQETGGDTEVWVIDEGANAETFNQPDEYEPAMSVEDFDLSKFEGNQRTVLEFYNKQVIPYLQKFRRDNLELIQDDNGYEWYETKVTPDDLLPVTAYRLKDKLAKVGINITNEQEQEILDLNKKIFGDTNVKIMGQILTNTKALGAYSNKMIQILNGQTDPKATLYHEVVHKYLDVFTTRDEHIALLKEAQRKYNLDSITEVEERIAEDFIQYAKSREGASGKFKVLFDKVIARTRAFFKQKDLVDDLYKDIISGKAKERTPEAVKVEMKPKPKSESTKDEPIGTGQEKNSRLFERVKETLGAEYEAQELKYNELSLEQQANDVITLIETNPERAVRIARGFEESPSGLTRNAISIALAELARSQGDFQTASELWTKTSLRSTRLGQEIVTLRGGFMETETLNAVKRVLDIRLANVAKKYKNIIAGLNVSEDASTIKKVDALVSHEARKLKKEMKKRQAKIKSAQEIIDSIRC